MATYLDETGLATLWNKIKGANTTYSLSKSGDTITLSGSDNSSTTADLSSYIETNDDATLNTLTTTAGIYSGSEVSIAENKGRVSADSSYIYFTHGTDVSSNTTRDTQWRLIPSSGNLQYRQYTDGTAGSWTNPFWHKTESQTANTVLAAPNGSAGAASFRKLVAADIPNLNASKITAGTLAAARLPDIYYSDLADTKLVFKDDYYATSINNGTSAYTTASNTGWSYIGAQRTIIAAGYISASIKIDTAVSSTGLYMSAADRYLRLPTEMTNIISVTFGTAIPGSSNSFVSAILRGDKADYLPSTGSLKCIKFRFTSPVSIGTAATQLVPVILVGKTLT